MNASRTAALVALTFTACHKHHAASGALVRRSLPGFTIELPVGVEKLAQLDYTAGKLRLEKLDGGDGAMIVYWSFGKAVDEASALDIARTADRGDGIDPQGAHVLAGKPGGATLVANDADGEKLQSYLQCGSRVISIATYKMPEYLHRKILEGLDCSPDQAKETAATTIPIAIDLPGFAVFQRTPGTLSLTSATGTVMLRRQPATSLTLEDFERESGTLFRAMGLDAKAEPRRGNVLPFTANVDGAREWGVLRPIDCADSKILIIATAADQATAVDLEQRIQTARCLEHGESPPAWPDVPDQSRAK